MLDLQAIAKALNGEVNGQFARAPAPGHSQRDRSLWIRIDHQAPDGFLVGGFAGEGWQELKDYVRDRLGLDRDAPRARTFVEKPLKQTFPTDNRQRALELVKASRPITSTIAERYLIARIGREIEWPTCLRFHPSCPRSSERLPALIAVMRDALTNEFRCIQRIFLQPDGRDRLRDGRGKLTLGPAAGAVCKLTCDQDVTCGLGVAEGVEKALAIMAAGWTPIWATCGSSTLSSFPVLNAVESLTLFADRDEAGQRAASACARRWADEGREAIIRTPLVTGDWGDVLMESVR